MKKNSFLERLAESIADSRIVLHESAIVLPNKRAKRMLLKALASKNETPVFAPTVYAIDEFMDLLSPYERLDKVSLMVKLFVLCREENPDAVLDDVFSWAPSFIDDVSELDMQMDDVKTVLSDLAEFKDFESRLGQDSLSKLQEQKIELFRSFPELYDSFVKTLRNQQCGYPGMIYRDCAEHISEYVQRLPYKNYVFAGFHVLNPAELSVVSYIKKNYPTQVYFDIDPFYCDFNKNDRYSTAHFVRKICQRLEIPEESILYKSSDYKETEKDVRIVGTLDVMNQINYALHCLEEIRQKQGNLNDTAVVLADEQLLLPFLAANGIENVNVTMGYPFRATPAFTLMDGLFELYRQAIQFPRRNNLLLFHRRKLVEVFRSPLVRKYLFQNKKQYNSFIRSLDESQQTLWSKQDLETLNDDLSLPDTDVKTDGVGVLHAVLSYMEQIYAKVENANKQDASLLQILLEQIRATEELLQPLQNVMTFGTMRYLVNQQVSNLSVPIKGDANEGLQVMGLLETRTMDFKNVIMLSVNEGVLPSGIKFNSLIPFDFKFNGESIENYLYKDQVYAYHFFRLLQRAENVVLLYNNVSSGTSMAEKSRFIMQLEFEVEEQHLDNIKLSYPVVAYPYIQKEGHTYTGEKTREIVEKLHNYEYSATSLHDYIQCPFLFYLKNICGIIPPDTFKDKVGLNTIGTAVHDFFENVMNEVKDDPYNYTTIVDEYLQNLESKVKDWVLKKEYFGNQEHNLQQGRIFLAVKLIEKDVENYLKAFKDDFNPNLVTILGNEEKLTCNVELQESVTVKLKGKLDRLQKKGDILEVIDYKTGKVKPGDLKLPMSSLNDCFLDPKYEKFVQLFVYAYLYQKNREDNISKEDEKISCAIISIVDLNKKEKYLHYAQIENDENTESETGGRKKKSEAQDFFDLKTMEILEKGLKDLLNRILDEDKPFEQTKDTDNCTHCTFRYMCNR